MKPIVTFFSIPFIILTLGLFLLVINALMLMFTAWIAGRRRHRLPRRRLLDGGARLDRDHPRELGHRRHRPQGRRLARADAPAAAHARAATPSRWSASATSAAPPRPTSCSRRGSPRPGSTTGSRSAAAAPATGTSAGRWTPAPPPPSSRRGTTRAATAPGSTTTPGPPRTTSCSPWTTTTSPTSADAPTGSRLFRDFDPVGAGRGRARPLLRRRRRLPRGAHHGRAHRRRPRRRALGHARLTQD